MSEGSFFQRFNHLARHLQGELTEKELRVLLVLMSYADNQTAAAWPSVQTIANAARRPDANADVRQTQRAIKSLAKKGIVLTPEDSQRGGRGKSAVRRIAIPPETVVSKTTVCEPERVVSGNGKRVVSSARKGGVLRQKTVVADTTRSSHRSTQRTPQQQQHGENAAAVAGSGLDEKTGGGSGENSNTADVDRIGRNASILASFGVNEPARSELAKIAGLSPDVIESLWHDVDPKAKNPVGLFVSRLKVEAAELIAAFAHDQRMIDDLHSEPVAHDPYRIPSGRRARIGDARSRRRGEYPSDLPCGVVRFDDDGNAVEVPA